MMIFVRGGALCFFLSALLPPNAAAQQTPFDVLLPEIKDSASWSRIQVRAYSEQGTSQPGTRYRDTRYDWDYAFPIRLSGATDRLFDFHIHTGMRDLQTDASLPNTVTRFSIVEPLFDLGGAATYRQMLDNGWTAGVSFGLNAISDKPFTAKDDVPVTAMGFLRMPSGGHSGQDAWLAYVDYNQSRDYARNVPLPGIGYLHRSQNLQVLIGAPNAMLSWQPTKQTEINVSYIMPRKILTEISQVVIRPALPGEATTRLFGGFDWDHEQFYRFKNPATNDLLSYYEKRFRGGLRYQMSSDISAELEGGYAFDRFWYEGDRYSRRNFNRVNIDDGAFGGFAINARL